MLCSLLFAALAAHAARAAVPLVDVRQPWPYAGPYQVDTLTSADSQRGSMVGYNRCTNSTQDSMCVNAVQNSILDFCIYAPPQPKGECVAWCNSPKYNTRVIPPGAITGMLVVKTPGYLAIAANLNGELLNIQAGDEGGELDPHGADNRGNPIGTLMYSNALANAPTGENQIVEWHARVPKTSTHSYDQLCVNPTPNQLCDNTHDTVGCNANIPLPYDSIGSSFSQCLGEDQNLGANVYTPPISACTTYSSAQIFANAAVPTSSSASSMASSSIAGSPTTSAPTRTATTTAFATVSTSAATGAAMPTRVAAPGLAAALGLVAVALV